MDTLDEAYVRNLMSSGQSDREISNFLTRSFPDREGFSVRSLSRWRVVHGFKKTNPVSQDDVERHVRAAVGNIGTASGRRFVKGYLESLPNPVKISEKRIAKALKDVYPAHHGQRRDRVLQNLNPVPYRADYFGHRLHMDQNEKLAAFGVTHVAAVDGFAGYVVGHATMPIKNNMTIYDNVYRPALLEHGFWDQLVVDHGGEFHLTLSGQNFYEQYRNNQARTPYIQITSTKNNRVERVWVEVNQRVNYPVKDSFEHLVDQGVVDPGDNAHKFTLSTIGQQVTSSGLCKLFDARNSRYCRGRGVPRNLMLQQYGCAPVPANLAIMTGTQAATSYRANGGIITDPHPFGTDPLDGHPAHQQRRDDMLCQYRFSIDELYSLLASNQSAAFESFVSYAIDVDRLLYNNAP